MLICRLPSKRRNSVEHPAPYRGISDTQSALLSGVEPTDAGASAVAGWTNGHARDPVDR